MKPTKAVADAIEAARKEGRVEEGPPVRLSEFRETAMTEKEFQQKVMLYAKAHGWRCYHTFDSRRSQPGFPDLVLVRTCKAKRLIFAELKAEKGVLTAEQQEWVDALRLSGAFIYVWRPSDLPAIERLLQ